MRDSPHDRIKTKKCVDCPAHITAVGAKARCPSCAYEHERSTKNRQAKDRRKRLREERHARKAAVP